MPSEQQHMTLRVKLHVSYFLGEKLLTTFEQLSFTEYQLNVWEKEDFNELIAEIQKALKQAQAAKHYNLLRKEVK